MWMNLFNIIIFLQWFLLASEYSLSLLFWYCWIWNIYAVICSLKSYVNIKKLNNNMSACLITITTSNGIIHTLPELFFEKIVCMSYNATNMTSVSYDNYYYYSPSIISHSNSFFNGTTVSIKSFKDENKMCYIT